MGTSNSAEIPIEYEMKEVEGKGAINRPSPTDYVMEEILSEDTKENGKQPSWTFSFGPRILLEQLQQGGTKAYETVCSTIHVPIDALYSLKSNVMSGISPSLTSPPHMEEKEINPLMEFAKNLCSRGCNLDQNLIKHVIETKDCGSSLETAAFVSIYLSVADSIVKSFEIASLKPNQAVLGDSSRYMFVSERLSALLIPFINVTLVTPKGDMFLSCQSRSGALVMYGDQEWRELHGIKAELIRNYTLLQPGDRSMYDDWAKCINGRAGKVICGEIAVRTPLGKQLCRLSLQGVYKCHAIKRQDRLFIRDFTSGFILGEIADPGEFALLRSLGMCDLINPAIVVQWLSHAVAIFSNEKQQLLEEKSETRYGKAKTQVMELLSHVHERLIAAIQLLETIKKTA